MSARATHERPDASARSAGIASRRTLILVCLISALAIAFIGKSSFESQRTTLLEQRSSELASIRDLKRGQITQWRSSLISDGRSVVGDAATVDEVRSWALSSGDPAVRSRLEGWMRALIVARGYAGAHLVSADGTRWISVGDMAAPSARETSEAVAAVGSVDATLTDLYLDTQDGLPRLDVVAPMRGANRSASAVLLLRADPAAYLYPLIKGWPVPSKTSETLLLRREGDSVLYLNDLRYRSGAALRFSIPTGNSQLLGVQALTGEPRVVEGVDYRGVPVVGALGPIQGSDWFIVAKTDQSEAYAAIESVRWTTLLSTGLGILLLIAGSLLIWRLNTVAILKSRLEAERTGQDRLDRAVEGAPVPIMIHAEDGEVLQVNRAWVELTGYSLDDIPTTSAWAQRAYGARSELVKEDIEALYGLKARKEEGEYAVKIADGTERIWDFTSAPLGRLADGRRFVMSVARDVTERKAAEALLRESEERLSALFQNMDEGLAYCRMIYDGDNPVDWIYLQVNDAFERQTGLVGAQGRPVSEVIPGIREADPELFERYSRVALTREPERFESFVESLSMWFDLRVYSPAKGDFIVIFDVITDRKNAEREAVEREERLRALLDNAPYGAHMYEIEPDDRLVFIGYNERAVEMLGVDHEQYMGKTLEEAFPGNVGTETPEQFRRVAREGGTWSTTQYAYADDRITGVFELYSFSYEPGKMAVFFRDITDIKKAEIALQEKTEDLERSNAELEKFAYVASHDLQEPLRMVASYTQLLQQRYAGRLDSDADEFIGYAVDGATRMRTLINDLLAYSRVGTQGAPMVETDLEKVLNDVLFDLEPSLKEVGATVERDHMPTVLCDPVQIGQVFQNLISNAAKFRGTQPPLIKVRVQREGPEWVFSVSDNGMGIDPQYFERIFVIFQRLESRSKYPGTGIGLAICKRIITRHGGRIWVDSVPGSGSTFYFTLHTEGDGSNEQ